MFSLLDHKRLHWPCPFCLSVFHRLQVKSKPRKYRRHFQQRYNERNLYAWPRHGFRIQNLSELLPQRPRLCGASPQCHSQLYQSLLPVWRVGITFKKLSLSRDSSGNPRFFYKYFLFRIFRTCTFFQHASFNVLCLFCVYCIDQNLRINVLVSQLLAKFVENS